MENYLHPIHTPYIIQAEWKPLPQITHKTKICLCYVLPQLLPNVSSFALLFTIQIKKKRTKALL